jgi:hypothetical protein
VVDEEIEHNVKKLVALVAAQEFSRNDVYEARGISGRVYVIAGWLVAVLGMTLLPALYLEEKIRLKMTGTGVSLKERENIHNVAFRLAYLLFCYPLWWFDKERECSFAELVALEFNIDYEDGRPNNPLERPEDRKAGRTSNSPD